MYKGIGTSSNVRPLVGKKGRPAKSGERYACGKLKPSAEPMSGALWQRLKQHGKKLGIDERLVSEVGRLNCFAELTVAQTAAALRIGEVYGRYERLRGLKRSIRSPSYERIYGASLEDVDAELVESATKAFVDLQGMIERAGGKPVPIERRDGTICSPPSHLLASIEALCVEDRAINPAQYDDVRALLNTLAAAWNIKGATAARAAPAKRPPIDSQSDASTSRRAAGAPRPNLDRIYWVQVARKLRPDMSEEKLGEAYEMQQALKARAIMRRGKTPGAVA